MLVCQRVICNAGLGNDSAVSCESKPVTTVIHVRIRCHPFVETCRMCWSLLVAKHVYIYIYIYVCVNILAHIHIILHKLWVSKYPVYIYWVASKYQNLDPQNPSKSNDLVVYSTMAMGQHGHGARHKARLPCQAKLRRKSQGCASWSDWLVRIECSAGFCNCGYKSSNQWYSTGL